MSSGSVVKLNITNVNKDVFKLILSEITVCIVNDYFKVNFDNDNVYEFIKFKDNNKRNLNVNNLELVH